MFQDVSEAKQVVFILQIKTLWFLAFYNKINNHIYIQWTLQVN